MVTQKIWRLVLCGVAVFSFWGCGQSQQPLTPLAQKVKAVYMANCIVCHNADPTKDGNVGPANAGSSLELLRARVLEGKYPPGHHPKRNTNLMTPLPQLKDDIEALHEFLNSQK